MGGVIDLIIIAVIIICTYLGYKRGLAKVLIKLLSFFIAIIISVMLYQPISKAIVNNTQIDDKIREVIIVNLNKQEEKENKKETQSPIIDGIMQNIETATNEVKDNAVKIIATRITDTIISVGTFIVLFIITKIALTVIAMFTNLISSLPIIKQFNSAGGLAYGLIEGLFIVYLFFAILSIISPLMMNSELLTNINSSFIGKYMYNNNFLLKMIF